MPGALVQLKADGDAKAAARAILTRARDAKNQASGAPPFVGLMCDVSIEQYAVIKQEYAADRGITNTLHPSVAAELETLLQGEFRDLQGYFFLIPIPVRTARRTTAVTEQQRRTALADVAYCLGAAGMVMHTDLCDATQLGILTNSVGSQNMEYFNALAKGETELPMCSDPDSDAFEAAYVEGMGKSARLKTPDLYRQRCGKVVASSSSVASSGAAASSAVAAPVVAPAPPPPPVVHRAPPLRSTFHEAYVAGATPVEQLAYEHRLLCHVLNDPALRVERVEQVAGSTIKVSFEARADLPPVTCSPRVDTAWSYDSAPGAPGFRGIACVLAQEYAGMVLPIQECNDPLALLIALYDTEHFAGQVNFSRLPDPEKRKLAAKLHIPEEELTRPYDFTEVIKNHLHPPAPAVPRT